MMDKMSCGEKGAKMGLQGTVGRAQNMIDDLRAFSLFMESLASKQQECLSGQQQQVGRARARLGAICASMDLPVATCSNLPTPPVFYIATHCAAPSCSKMEQPCLLMHTMR